MEDLVFNLHPLCESGLHYILRGELLVHPMEWARMCALTNSATTDWAVKLAAFFLSA